MGKQVCYLLKYNTSSIKSIHRVGSQQAVEDVSHYTMIEGVDLVVEVEEMYKVELVEAVHWRLVTDIIISKEEGIRVVLSVSIVRNTITLYLNAGHQKKKEMRQT